MNQVQTSIGGGGATTTEISNIQILVQNFQKLIASGNTGGISALLNTFLEQLNKLQGDIKVADSRNVIIALIGNIYTLQQSLQSGNVDMSSFQFFIKNIQEGLQKVASIESSGGSSSGGGGGGGGTSVTNDDISNVQSLFTQLQNIFNSGSTQGAASVLQSLVALLQSFTSKVSDNNALQILNTIIQNISQMQQQASSGSLSMSSFASLLMQSVNSLNQFIQVLNSSAGGSSSGGTNGGWTWNVSTGPVVMA